MSVLGNKSDFPPDITGHHLRWILLAVFAFALTCLVAFIWIFSSDFDRQLKNVLTTEKLHNALLSKQIEQKITNVFEIIESQSNNIKNLILQQEIKEIDYVQVVSDFSLNSMVNSVSLFNSERKLRSVAYFKNGGQTLQLDSDDWFERYTKINSNNVSDRDENKLHNLKYRIFSTDINNQEQSFLEFNIFNQDQSMGFILIDLNHEGLRLDGASNNELFRSQILIDKNGELLLSSPSSVNNRVSVDKFKLLDSFKNEIGLTESTGFSDGPAFRDINKLPNLNWLLVSEISLNDVYSMIFASYYKKFSLILVFIIAVSGFIFFTYRKIVKYLSLWIKAISGIIDGNFSIDLPESNCREVNHLSKTLSQLSLNRKKSTAELIASKNRLQLHREQIPLAIIECDNNFIALDWNPAAECIFGYSRDQVIGKFVPELIFEKSHSANYPIAWQQLLLNKVNNNINNKGELVICNWFSTALVDETGKVVGVSSLIEDITIQEQTKSILAIKEQEHKLILDNMVVAVFSIDENGKILNLNNMALKLFGYDRQELIGKNISTLADSEDAKHHDSYLKRYLVSGERKVVGLNREILAKKKNGDLFPIQLMVSELWSVDGRKTFIGTCLDLTEQKEKEEQLRRSQRMDALGKLTGGIAHDFNNMLSVICGFSEMLTAELQDSKELLEYSEEIQRAGERSRKLTSKLLAFSRATTTTAQQADLNQLLVGQENLLKKTLTARVKLEFDLEPDIWAVMVDSNDFEDSILNLSINAAHALPKGGEIRFTTQNVEIDINRAATLKLTPGEYVELQVTDNGIGMEENTKEKIFDPFFTTKGEKGTGLGLSQVFGFVKRANGIIAVNSIVGEGSCFSLFFPRCCKNVSSDQMGKANSCLFPVADESILVVDDEPSLCKLASKILEANGYNVYQKESGKSALAFLDTQNVDLILSDIVMPEMDGYELAENIQERFPDIKILLASGFDNPEIKSGENVQHLKKNILLKPYRTQELLDSVKQLLHKN